MKGQKQILIELKSSWPVIDELKSSWPETYLPLFWALIISKTFHLINVNLYPEFYSR